MAGLRCYKLKKVPRGSVLGSEREARLDFCRKILKIEDVDLYSSLIMTDEKVFTLDGCLNKGKMVRLFSVFSHLHLFFLSTGNHFDRAPARSGGNLNFRVGVSSPLIAVDGLGGRFVRWQRLPWCFAERNHGKWESLPHHPCQVCQVARRTLQDRRGPVAQQAAHLPTGWCCLSRNCGKHESICVPSLPGWSPKQLLRSKALSAMTCQPSNW